MEIISRKQALESGLNRYFTGKPCKYGHVTERVARNGYCCGCKSLEHRTVSRKMYMKKYNKMHYENNREYHLHYSRMYKANNKEYLNKINREWTNLYRETPRGKAASIRFSMLARTPYDRDGQGTDEFLGYTLLDFIEHIEGMFKAGMTWNNHGTWEVDHIKPIKAFLDLGITDPREIHALSNLQPLWMKHNRAKGYKYLC